MQTKELLNFINPFKSPENKKADLSKINNDPAGVMAAIIQAAYSDYKKEITNWRSGRGEALDNIRPRRQSIIELYEDLKTDAIVLSEYQKRIDRILNKEFKVIDFTSKKENPEKTDLFNKSWFYDYLQYALESKLEGFSLPYISEIRDGLIYSVDLVDRKHVIPELSAYLPNLQRNDMINYTEGNLAMYFLPVGKMRNLGLLDAIAPLYILKKHSWANWDDFEQKFGVPVRIAKTASTDPKVQATIKTWLADMGASAWGLFPAGTDLEIKESNQTDAFSVFNEKRKAANEEICILLNSQWETGNQTGSRAKTESVMENTQDETTKSDLRFLYFLVNDILMPKLAALGYPINPETDVFQWSIPDNLQEKLNIFKGVSDLGFELDPVQVEETFNVKILGKKEISTPTPGTEPKPGKK